MGLFSSRSNYIRLQNPGGVELKRLELNLRDPTPSAMNQSTLFQGFEIVSSMLKPKEIISSQVGAIFMILSTH